MANKYGSQLNIAIPPELKKQLEVFSANSGWKMKEIVAEALEQYMNMGNKQQN